MWELINLRPERRLKGLGAFSAGIVFVILFVQLWHFASLPDHERYLVGQKMEFISPSIPGLKSALELYMEKAQESETVGWEKIDGKKVPTWSKPGKFSLQWRFLGVIPLKKVSIDVVEPVTVIPGGQSIGVVLKSKGVIVVGYCPVADRQGKLKSPAQKAGIAVGDVITMINGIPVENSRKLATLTTSLGIKGKINVTVEREGRPRVIALETVYSPQDKSYRLGIFVRESAIGIGTLSFYNPRSMAFGALGHMIADGQAGRQISAGDGSLIMVPVEAIQQGRAGQAGEKVGVFSGASEYGGISRNTAYGIFGQLKRKPTGGFYNDPMPVALANQVKTGPAEVLTVLEGNTVKKFDIVIERVVAQRKPDSKGLIIRVSDPKLLARTGGIIQGMSGSPIIQDHKLVGAITHVFLSNPERGYGVLAEWMLWETKMLGEQLKLPLSYVALSGVSRILTLYI